MSNFNLKYLFRISYLVLLVGVTGCGPNYHTAIYNDPVYEQEKVDSQVLPEKGERYTRRADEPVDVSDIGPKPGEPYSRFRKRLFNTLATQEYQREQLLRRTGEKKLSVNSLQGQMESMKAHNREMRMTLAGYEADRPTEVQVPGIATETRFSHYLVREGDTLQKISKRIYGSHRGWLTLYRFNRKRLPDGPNRIEVGTELYIPSVQVLR